MAGLLDYGDLAEEMLLKLLLVLECMAGKKCFAKKFFYPFGKADRHIEDGVWHLPHMPIGMFDKLALWCAS